MMCDPSLSTVRLTWQDIFYQNCTACTSCQLVRKEIMFFDSW